MKESIVKNKSFEFALRIVELYKRLQAEKEFVLSNLLLRSGTSIGANINEALAGISRADFGYKMSLASKESRETLYCLQLLDKSQLVKFDYQSYINDCEELVKIPTAIVKTTKTKN